MSPILQSHLPFIAWTDPRIWRLPGIQPMAPGDWLRVDDAFAGQMAERDRLIAARPEAVHALADTARPAAEELLDRVLHDLEAVPGYCIGTRDGMRPDGAVVPLDRANPLLTLGRLVQEDLCLMESNGEEHVLTGAILCFPASWTLAQKFMQPLIGIHVPVDHYDADVARRVQRLFDAIRPEQPLWRANALVYEDPTLHQPRPEGEPRPRPEQRLYMRSERQCLVRLPQTGAVVFSIHTYLVRLEDLPSDAFAALADSGL